MNYSNIGFEALQNKDYKNAINYLQLALKHNPKNHEAHNNIALSYQALGQHDTAIFHLRKAIKIRPNLAPCYYNLAWQYLHMKKDLDKAEHNLKKTIELQSKEGDLDARAHWDLSYVYHLRGEYDKAWPEYEYRMGVSGQFTKVAEALGTERRWFGQDLDNLTLFVFCEQGMGDAIQFIRYLPLVKERYQNVKIIMHTYPALVDLFRPFCDEMVCVVEGEVFPYHDYYVSVMSLPCVLGNPPMPKTPYIFTDAKLDLNCDKFKIGLCWAGGIKHDLDNVRSCYLKHFRPLVAMPNVQVFGLQKDKEPKYYQNTGVLVDYIEDTQDMNIIDLGSSFNTFTDTTVAVNSMDLIVTVDTSMICLAGAMNKPAWDMIPYMPDWRWGLEGDTSRWYESVRLFRQDKPGDWIHVIKKICDALLEYPPYLEKSHD